MTKRLYFHVGTHKTATSSFQAWLDSNSTLLSDLNIKLITTGLQDHSHWPIVVSLIDIHPWHKFTNKYEVYVDMLYAEVSRSEQTNFIISTEAVAELVMYDFYWAKQLISDLYGLFEEIHILVTVREPKPFSASNLKFMLREEACEALSNPMLAYSSALNSYSEVISRLLSLSSTSHVVGYTTRPNKILFYEYLRPLLNIILDKDSHIQSDNERQIFMNRFRSSIYENSDSLSIPVHTLSILLIQTSPDVVSKFTSLGSVYKNTNSFVSNSQKSFSGYAHLTIKDYIRIIDRSKDMYGDTPGLILDHDSVRRLLNDSLPRDIATSALGHYDYANCMYSDYLNECYSSVSQL